MDICKSEGNFGKTKNRGVTPQNRYTKMEMYHLSNLFVLNPDKGGITV